MFWPGYKQPVIISARTPVAISTITSRVATDPSFKRELVYSGRSQGAVNILYREFSNDLARPAFSQALQYDLQVGSMIGFKGARFEILSADNTGITYRVLKPLD